MNQRTYVLLDGDGNVRVRGTYDTVVRHWEAEGGPSDWTIHEEVKA